jgi:hypothetical protein
MLVGKDLIKHHRIGDIPGFGQIGDGNGGAVVVLCSSKNSATGPARD